AARVDGARSLAAVHAALTRLPRRDREVLALCVGEGLDHRQVAEALGVPVGTVRSRLSRARARLRALSEEAAAERAPARHPHGSADERDDMATRVVALRLAEEPR
ncbi:RNA polymerase sigma factor, partial [Streptomyces sp. G35A]